MLPGFGHGDFADRFSQKAAAQFFEVARIIAYEETSGTVRRRAQFMALLKDGLDPAGDLFGGIYQSDTRSENAAQKRLQQRVMGAAEDQGIYASIQQRGKVFPGDKCGRFAIDPALLDQVHKKWAGG